MKKMMLVLAFAGGTISTSHGGGEKKINRGPRFLSGMMDAGLTGRTDATELVPMKKMLLKITILEAQVDSLTFALVETQRELGITDAPKSEELLGYFKSVLKHADLMIRGQARAMHKSRSRRRRRA